MGEIPKENVMNKLTNMAEKLLAVSVSKETVKADYCFEQIAPTGGSHVIHIRTCCVAPLGTFCGPWRVRY